MFTKLALLITSIFLISCILGQFDAQAGRTEYDLKSWSITVKGCDGEKCSYVSGVSKVTVQNGHWKDYHATPPRKDMSTHQNGHSASQRYTILSAKTIIKPDKCDGTECE